MKREVALLKYAFITTWRLYTGVSMFHDLPKISGHYYIHKPIIYERLNTRTKDLGYIEIIAEMPQSKPSTLPEYIIIMIHISYSDRMRPRDYKRVTRFLNKRIRKIKENINGYPHFFIYFVSRKYTTGVMEYVRKDYAKTRQQGVNMVLKLVEDPSTIINDLRNFLEKRLEKLLDKNLYKKSRYEIFSRPKRLAEYMLMLDAFLSGKREIGEYVGQLLHHTARVPVDSLVKLLYSIKYDNKEEEIRSKEEIRSFPKPTPYI